MQATLLLAAFASASEENWCQRSLTKFRIPTAEIRLDDLVGKLDFLFGVIRVHPQILNENLSFRRGIIGTLNQAGQVHASLGPQAAALDSRYTKLLKASYVSADDFRYDEAAIAQFLQARVSDLEALAPHLLPSGGLREQILHLKSSLPPEKFKSQATRLLRLMPFLFDSNGAARFSRLKTKKTLTALGREILQHTPQKLSGGYGDLIQEHLAKPLEELGRAPGMGQLQQLFETFRNGFIAKEVTKLLTPASESGASLGVRTLTAERVPAAVAILRGYFGGDCSILSVPFYSLHRDSRTHFIRKGQDPNSPPVGYVFSVLVDVDGKKVPYVMTVNGLSLSKTDAEMAIRLAAEDWGTTEVMLPVEARIRYLANTAETREAMNRSGKRSDLKFPEGWNRVQTFTDRNPFLDDDGHPYENYYHERSHGSALLTPFAALDRRLVGPIEQAESRNSRYHFNESAESARLLDRAILGYQALYDAEQKAYSRILILNQLKLTDVQLSAVRPVAEMSAHRPLEMQEFIRAKDTLGFNLDDLLARDLETRNATLSELYSGSRELFAEHRRDGGPRWVRAMAQAFDQDFSTMNELLAIPGLEFSFRGFLRLPRAYLAEAEWVWLLNSMVPPTSRTQMVKFLAGQFYRRSVTDTAFGQRMMARLRTPKLHKVFTEWLENAPVDYKEQTLTPILLEIAKRTEAMGSFDAAKNSWLRDPRIRAEDKARIIRIARLGSGSHLLTREIPFDQRDAVNDHLESATFLPLLRKLAGEDSAEFEVAPIHSFEFENFTLPPGGAKFRLGDSEVTLKSSFGMQRTPVTNRQWRWVMGEKPPKGGYSPDHPKNFVSWIDAVAYTKRLSDLDPDYNYRLPTEAEWEFAWRAGLDTGTNTADELTAPEAHAWTSRNSEGKLHNVAGLQPNANGLFDLLGNVNEWVGDTHSSAAEENQRTARGGDFKSSLDEQSLRRSLSPDERAAQIGFRVVRTPK